MVVLRAQSKVIAVASARKMLESLLPASTSVYTHVRILLQLVRTIYRRPFSLQKLLHWGRIVIQNEEEKKIIATHENLERICLHQTEERVGSRILDARGSNGKNYVRMQT